MSAPIAMTIGPDEAVRLVLRELERFAAPRKMPATPDAFVNLVRYKNIEVWFGEMVGDAVFHFVTHDNIEVSVHVNFADMDREYLNRLNHEVQKDLNRYRAGRKGLRVVDGGKLDVKRKLTGDSLSQSPPGGLNGKKKGSKKENSQKKDG